MIKFKEIRIQPSLWCLDVIVSRDRIEINKFTEQRYGIVKFHDHGNYCAFVESSKNSELNGKRSIVIVIESLVNKRIIVHELIHAIWESAKHTGYEMTYDTQEWQAVLFEYLYAEMCDKKGYSKY